MFLTECRAGEPTSYCGDPCFAYEAELHLFHLDGEEVLDVEASEEMSVVIGGEGRNLVTAGEIHLCLLLFLYFHDNLDLGLSVAEVHLCGILSLTPAIIIADYNESVDSNKPDIDTDYYCSF